MDIALFLLVAVVVLALAFDYINGFHDAANAIATVVSTRVLSPKVAVLYGGILNFVGAMAGTEVAATVGKGLVEADVVTMPTILFALIGAIVWNLFTWFKGLPSSSSHALIGSLLGAVFVANWQRQAEAIQWQAVLNKVVLPMFSSPVLGFILGFWVMFALIWLVARWRLNVINAVFGKLQIASAGWMAFNHGHNDAQKSMGIIALAVATYYHQEAFHVDTWMILSCALAMGLGTLSGGWKIIRTLGTKMIKLQPIHGFAAEATGGLVIWGASELGIPVSTTHVISSAIMGVGTTKRASAVKWGIVGNILMAWVLTIPATFLLSGGLVLLFKAF